MRKIKSFFTHIGAAIAFNQLPPEKRQLTFYSEGKNYWSYLAGLLGEVLDQSELEVCFITSSKDDPVFDIRHPRLRIFLIDEGFVRDWLFANIDTKVMVMTMPDLNQYQVKKSKFPVHYVYTQHSLVSFHMVYRPGAFDHFDTVFCSGPHHLKEMRAMEKLAKLPPKSLFNHGYARLDSILKEARKPKTNTDKIHYLLAPSWGETGTIETGLGKQIAELLINAGHQLTLRPHPMTLKFSKDKVDEIISLYEGHPNFAHENNVKDQTSLHSSDVMICDWSGAALDYAFGLQKPVIFIDSPRKVNNPDYQDLEIEPFEVSIRNEIGKIIPTDKLERILDFEIKPLPEGLVEKYVFNPGSSDVIGARELLRIVEERPDVVTSNVRN